MKTKYFILIFLLVNLQHTESQNSSTKTTVNIIVENKIIALENKVKKLEVDNDSLSEKLNKFLIEDYKSTDVIDKVNNYYDNAWNKLIYLLSIIGGLIVVILPILLTLQQKRELNLNKREFQDDTDRKILELEKKIIEFNKEEIQKIRIEIETVNNSLSNKQKKDINKIYAMTYYLQGLNAITNKNYDLTISSFMSTVKHITITLEETNLPMVLSNIIVALEAKVKANSKLNDADKKELEETLSNLETTFPGKYDKEIKSLKEKIDKV